MGKPPRIIILHDWLTGMRGGEKCLEIICGLFPTSRIFTLFATLENISPIIRERIVETSFLNSLPNIENYYRYLLPLYPLAIQDLSYKLKKEHEKDPFDLILSISHCAVKNITPPKGVKHICYCLTPMRYIWDQYDAYFSKSKMEFIIRRIAHLLQNWDKKGSNNVDKFYAISDFIASRIHKYYDRRSNIIYPPVDFSWLLPQENYIPGKNFICVSAFVPYKKIDLVIKAFNSLSYELLLIGHGPEEANLRKIASCNIKFAKNLTKEELAIVYRDCIAMVFVAEEDFGMTTVEVQASGRPVIACNTGGSAEIIKDHTAWKRAKPSKERPSGILLDKISPESISEAVVYMFNNAHEFMPQNCKDAVVAFRADHFQEGFLSALRVLA